MATKQADIAQSGDRPSDFGDHEPIDEESVVQVSIDPEDLTEAKAKTVSSVREGKE